MTAAKPKTAAKPVAKKRKKVAPRKVVVPKAAKCVCCGREIKDGGVVRQVAQGHYVGGRFYPKRVWGYVHAPCMDRSWSTPAKMAVELQAVERRVLARAARNKAEAVS